MCEPLISVVLPVYNVENYLPKCMETLFAQTYHNLELLLIDDGSKKECAVLCDSFAKQDARVRVYHKINGGVSDARNYGVAHANGEYIAFVDPDDFVDQDYFEYLYRLVKQYKTTMSICQHRVVHTSGKIIDYGHDGDELMTAKTAIERMLYHDTIDTSAWAKLYHRSLFSEIDFPVGKQFEDIGTTYKFMLKSGRIAVGYQSKYNYIIRSDSISNCGFNRHKLDLLEMTDRMAADVVSIYPDLADAALRRRVYSRFSTLNQLLKTDEEEKLKQDMVNFIRQYQGQIIRNKRTPKRDKLAIISLSFGIKAYINMWTAYRKWMKGEIT